VTLTSLFLFTVIRIRNTALKRLLFSKYLSYINITKDKNSKTNTAKAKYAYVDIEIKSISAHTQLQVSTYLRS